MDSPTSQPNDAGGKHPGTDNPSEGAAREPSSAPGSGKGHWFTTTCWTDLIAARDSGSPQSTDALERLCDTYWYPLYAYIRRMGRTGPDAEDLTQAFFFQILRNNFLGAVDRKKGKFRSFLLASLNYFLSNERAFRNAEKRGGGRALASLDEKTADERYRLEPSTDTTPEKLFEVQWARTVLKEAMTRLRKENIDAGKGALFGALEEYLLQDASSGEYLPIAEKLGMSAGAVAVAVHRLRQRLGKILREEVMRTVASPDETSAELRHLCKVIGSVPAPVVDPDESGAH